MWADSFVTYFHFISIIGLFVVLFLEAILLKERMTNAAVKLIAKIDGYYGLLSIAVLLTGGLRLFYFGKGSDYYLTNSVFIIKISLFIIIGLLSIYPSIQFFRLRKNAEELIQLKNYQKLKTLIYVELVLLVCIPFLAVLMANGIG